MRRREFLGVLGGAAVAWPLPARTFLSTVAGAAAWPIVARAQQTATVPSRTSGAAPIALARRYQSTLREKIQALRGAAAGSRTLERASEVLQDLGKELERPRGAARPAGAPRGSIEGLAISDSI